VFQAEIFVILAYARDHIERNNMRQRTWIQAALKALEASRIISKLVWEC
jgi:hypothetical protein